MARAVLGFTAASLIGSVEGQAQLCTEHLVGPDPAAASGAGTLILPDGTLTGSVAGTVAPFELSGSTVWYYADVTMTITGGTGAYTGAIGTATMSEHLEGEGPDFLNVVSMFSGSFDVPH
jgi:hypothetical protein